MSLTRLPCASLGFLKEGCELINEALNLFNNVYGAMHVEICACLRLLARLNYIMGDHPEVRTHTHKPYIFLTSFFPPHTLLWISLHAECLLLQALSNQQKAVLMSERVLGIEHPNTIQEYVSVWTKTSLFQVRIWVSITFAFLTDALGSVLLC